MPYAEDLAGIYIIRNDETGNGYVGQSIRMRKRIADHFNLLRKGTHPNIHLQRAFSMYGEHNFSYDFEIVCEDATELDLLEGMYLTGDAVFDDTPVYYNIAKSPVAAMRGRKHSEDTKSRISATKQGVTRHVTPEYRAALSAAQLRRVLKDQNKVAKIKYIVDNPGMTYAERGRAIGMDTSSVRKLALRYTPIREQLDGEY